MRSHYLRPAFIKKAVQESIYTYGTYGGAGFENERGQLRRSEGKLQWATGTGDGGMNTYIAADLPTPDLPTPDLAR